MQRKITKRTDGTIAIEVIVHADENEHPSDYNGIGQNVYACREMDDCAPGDEGLFVTWAREGRDQFDAVRVRLAGDLRDGMPLILAEHRRQMNGWCGSDCNVNCWAHGWRRVVSVESRTRGLGWRTILSADLRPDAE